MSLVDRVAEALWIANEPWRQPGPFTAVVQPSWEHADDLDRELYRIKAQVIIEHLGLTEETKRYLPENGAKDKRRFVSKWWDVS